MRLIKYLFQIFKDHLSLTEVSFHVRFSICAKDSDGKSRSREGMPHSQLRGQAQLDTKGPHLILVEVLQGFDYPALLPQLPH